MEKSVNQKTIQFEVDGNDVFVSSKFDSGFFKECDMI